MTACTCGCCAGIETVTPAATYNAPGSPALTRRVGTHRRFLDTMLARLSRHADLADLTTREPDDLAVALLDGWAAVTHVLTFYQERIANEGYLRTATEPRSLVELGRLVGHRPRPALGSSVHLAYTLDPGSRTTVPAGSSARSVPAQGEQPQTFETAEDLEAREEWNSLLVRRTAPSSVDAVNIRGDLSEVEVAGTSANLKASDRMLFLFGAGDTPVARTVADARPDFTADTTAVSLVPLTEATGALGAARRELAAAVTAALVRPPASNRAQQTVATLTTLDAALAAATPVPPDDVPGWLPSLFLPETLAELREQSAVSRPRAPADAQRWFDDQVAAVISAGTRTLVAASTAQRQPSPDMADVLGGLLGSSPLSPLDEADDPAAGAALLGLTPLLAALRKPPSRPPASARSLTSGVRELFGADSDVHARLLTAADPRLREHLHQAWGNARIAPPVPLSGVQVMRVKARHFLPGPISSPPIPPVGLGRQLGDRVPQSLPLDAVHEGIVPGSWAVLEDGDVTGPVVVQVTQVDQQVLTQFVGNEGATVDVPVTVLTVVGADIDTMDPERVTVWAQGEALQAVGDPVRDDVQGSRIELDRAHDGLRPGRWLVITGERTDVPSTSGVSAGELAMVAGVRQRVDPGVPGDTVHTTLLLANDLAYSYRRDTVQLYGNVVAATQGETRTEVLGSGDAGAEGQSFPLRQVSTTTPLTWLPADNPLGADDALTVRVDGVRWHEVEALFDAAPTDHVHTARTRADGTATVAFGDGRRGARLPNGVENVSAEYRVGGGRSGNLASRQISQLASRPLGVSGVLNPLPATGGSDGDGDRPEEARALTPLRVLALDRLVATRDHEDFTRARAGIGKASARQLFDGGREVVHVTIAGQDDAPIDPTSQLVTSLRTSLATFGDAHLPVQVAVRDLVLIVLSAGVRVHPDHIWELVEPGVRAAALSALGFEHRELGEPAFLSRVVAAMQAVPGVTSVDVDVFRGIDGHVTPAELAAIGGSLTGADPCVPAAEARYREDSHWVQEEETLTGVARRYGLTLDELVRLNPALEEPLLTVGQRLVVFRGIRPAQLAVLSPDVPDTLLLRRIP